MSLLPNQAYSMTHRKNILATRLCCWLLLLLCQAPAWADDMPQDLDQLLQRGALDEAADRSDEEETTHYLSRLLAQVEREQLWRKATWQRLLHYKPNLLGGLESQVDGRDFFLSRRGKHDPRAEMRATLAGFFTTMRVPPTQITPQCRFPARYQWLDRELHFDPDLLPTQSCKKFDFYMKGVNPVGLTVVFPAEHPDSPSSMFGHTLIRLDRANQTTATRMLDYTINFAAEAGDASGVGYAVNGLVGGFEGRFRIIPYYMKLREYAQMENRDIWEYRLKVTPEQARFIAAHAWELVPTYYDYYFFTENCAYHLLSLMEPALPQQSLTEDFHGWVLPVDILRQLRRNDLVAEVNYYPSRYRTILARRDLLGAADEKLALAIFNEGLTQYEQTLKSIAEPRQAGILDLAYEYRRYAGIASSQSLDPKLGEDERQLLLARSRLGIPSEPPPIPTPDTPPDLGHPASRIGLGYGAAGDEHFLQIDWRAVYHDWLDPVPGHSTSYALAFGSVAARYYADGNRRRLRLQKLHLIRIDNMEPWDTFFRRISWRVVTGAEALTIGDDDKLAYVLRGGPGFSYSSGNKRHLVYGLVEAEIAAAEAYDNDLRLAAGPSIGLLSTIGPHWRLRLSASYLADLAEDTQDSARLQAGLSWNARQGPSLRLTGGRLRQLDGWHNEALLSIKVYF